MFDLKTKILVIDDAPSMREFVVKCLREIGFINIIEAEDGEKGFELLSTSNPKVELIFADWNMPKCSGLELLKKIRKIPEFHKLPFIMVTVNSHLNDTLEAVKEGVNNFVVKPFTTEVLRQKLIAVANKR